MISPQGWCWTAPSSTMACHAPCDTLWPVSLLYCLNLLNALQSLCKLILPQSLLVTCYCSDLLLQGPQLGWLNADLPISIPNLLILGSQFSRNSNLMLSLRNSHLERWMSSKSKLSQLHINSHQTKKK
jgi:hypothetical protein